uniref:FixH family protein n=1 Tax=Thaumasiovibrio occultus TaxID=1891184 RepID=UPI000B3580DB|nr:FixH family protein [Thaumasiovibrio occultus]
MKQPWYRQFWPWFLIALPTCAVVASISTFIIFNNNPVSLVAEDYYKRGKAINVDFSRVDVATERGLQAWVSLDGPKGYLRLDKGDLPFFPALRVIFSHRTLEGRDTSAMLQPDAAGTYRFTLDKALEGPWHLKVESVDKEWLLQRNVAFPTEHEVAIHSPAQ